MSMNFEVEIVISYSWVGVEFRCWISNKNVEYEDIYIYMLYLFVYFVRSNMADVSAREDSTIDI